MHMVLVCIIFVFVLARHGVLRSSVHKYDNTLIAAERGGYFPYVDNSLIVLGENVTPVQISHRDTRYTTCIVEEVLSNNIAVMFSLYYMQWFDQRFAATAPKNRRVQLLRATCTRLCVTMFVE